MSRLVCSWLLCVQVPFLRTVYDDVLFLTMIFVRLIFSLSSSCYTTRWACCRDGDIHSVPTSTLTYRGLFTVQAKPCRRGCWRLFLHCLEACCAPFRFLRSLVCCPTDPSGEMGMQGK
ncbi:uncharacterized protein BT62DRAFT_471523 [Guyanagaster necrorhizus]|uniref:Uncharacterized protein n=1 Tax=Guyanagaster necrorhizus TaxID=856835 RepID=A0A9P8AMX9_9AGAR|nr:uncharacterized protein BT62DRAFT_471523 [Guyanagaster necrorhizus MCA 3950]KAG7441708.1 hypothetical protein BT62DRAFT_471523 [Guyanagaster necrorhizus MCA 3950]